jgi:hypothetical protein
MERHNAHVEHIKANGCLQMSVAHTSSCSSLSYGSQGVMYGGCIGELSCSCAQAGVCKHLQAACELSPFTHRIRCETAEAIVSRGGLHLTDAETGLCQYK